MKNAYLLTGMLLGSALLLSADVVSAQDWPQWRGPNRDNKVTDFAVPKTWPAKLNNKWRVTVGQGESSPLLVGDKVYVFGRQGAEEVTVCLDAATGKEIWKDKYATAAVTGGDSGHPGPRSTPAMADGKICTFGVNGVLSCLDAATGKQVWRNLNTGKVNQFHTACSPIIVDGMCIVYTTALTAFDLANGKQKWQSPGGGTAPFGSPVLMTVEGVKQIVMQTGGKPAEVVGASLADGKILWKANFGGDSITPIIDGQIVLCSGPNAGTMALKIEKQGDSFKAKELWKQPKVSATKYNTPVLKDGVLNGGLLFGISGGRNIFCLDAKTGKELWTDKTPRGDCGHILNAGAVRFLALTNDCELVVFEPSAAGFKPITTYEVADKPAKGGAKGGAGGKGGGAGGKGGGGGFGGVSGPWACPIITGNRIFVKDQTTLTLWTLN